MALAAPRTRRRRWAAAAVVAAALVFLLVNGLRNATLYFRTADEAVAQRDSLGARRFRIEGTVVDGTVRRDGDDVRFAIEANDVTVGVRHRGDPPELFRPGIPVVLEGRWAGTTFASDRILVKHSNEYRAKHGDRLDRARAGR